MSDFPLADLIPLRAVLDDGPKRVGPQISERTALRLQSLGAIRVRDGLAHLTPIGKRAANEYAARAAERRG